MLPKMLGLVLAAAFTSASVTGFPALAAAVASSDQRAELGVLLAALTVTRLPLLLLGPFQAFLVPGFTRRLLEQGWSRTWPLLGGLLAGVVAAGAVVCAVAWWWGADVVSLLYGDAYRIGDLAVAAMTAGATITAVLLVLAACLVALDGHRWVVASWAACFVGILVALVVPGSGLVPRVVGALIAGPAVGAVVAAVGLLRAGSDRRVGFAQPSPG
jgi:O-antigen/teichoic acid export membrane protein